MDGFISYPRTDNTVYPRSLNTRELVQSLARIPEFSAAQSLLEGELTATRGKKETTDHPPSIRPLRCTPARSTARSGGFTSSSCAVSSPPSRRR
jgi:DNA topoisomerase-1